MGGDPGLREQCFVLLFGRVVHELLEDPLEVGERIEAVAADLLDEGVDDRAAPSGVFPSKEEPVLGADLGWADLVFGEVVVDLDLPIQEAGFEMRPLVPGVA